MLTDSQFLIGFAGPGNLGFDQLFRPSSRSGNLFIKLYTRIILVQLEQKLHDLRMTDQGYKVFIFLFFFRKRVETGSKRPKRACFVREAIEHVFHRSFSASLALRLTR